MKREPSPSAVTRRRFLQAASTTALLAALPHRSIGAALSGRGRFVLLREPGDEVATSAQATWATDELARALEHHGATVRRIRDLGEVAPDEYCIAASGPASGIAGAICRQRGLAPPTGAEVLAIGEGEAGGRSLLLAAGADVRGLVYALTELADRVRCRATDRNALEFTQPLVERPASRVRSTMRGFNSEIEDKVWFYDRDYWREYLDLLAYSRINRLNFTTGMGYNLAVNVSDGYLLFPYPFLLDVPGYSVRAQGLSADERDRNLAIIRFVGEECARRTIDFQFGIWTLAYDWPRSPNATYRIEGLTDATHGTYCRDALAMLLREVPTIGGVTFRVHEESGIPRGQESFWATQFHAFAQCGRRVGIDMHAKSMSPETLAHAEATGQPVTISPKFGGEHQPLPYHQASIRRREMARPGAVRDTGSGVLEGDRGFTRYGYADALAENRTWDVVFRIWPGTQRFLLSGDPALVAGYGRQASFCGAAGIELSEPLHFKGRCGTGVAGGRCAYADDTLTPGRDFRKYDYFYRLWGRLGYNPDSEPEIWRRHLRRAFGPAAGAVERALGPVGRVLPLITTAHAPSADCLRYLPEIYTSIPIAETARELPNYDMLAPKRFGNVSPLDPQLFQSCDEHAEALLYGPVSGKYTPWEVARWLEVIAAGSMTALEEARLELAERARAAEFRRIEEDVRILCGIARLLAGKFRAAVLWRIHVHSGNREAGETAIARYCDGREAWVAMAERARGIYREGISYGSPLTTGHWMDRVGALDEDIETMRTLFASGTYRADQLHHAPSARAMADLSRPSARPGVAVRHEVPRAFVPGRPLQVALGMADAAGFRAFLHYRHVNHADPWERLELAPEPDGFCGEIPAACTAGRFPLQYYFEILTPRHEATLIPALGSDLAGVPYHVVRSNGGES